MATEPNERGAGAGVREHLHRNLLRARNGIKWLAGTEFAPEHPTQSDVIWRGGKAEMRHYRRDSPPRLGPPVVAFLGLVGRSNIFDLYKGGSIVQMLMDWGFDAYVMDWGVADELDSPNTLETYMGHYLPQALKAAAGVWRAVPTGANPRGRRNTRMAVVPTLQRAAQWRQGRFRLPKLGYRDGRIKEQQL